MSTLIEFISLIFECMKQTLEGDTIRFWVSIGIGLFLGIGCWVAANFSARLWNKHFYLSLLHHILCCGAAVLTVFFVVLYASMDFMKPTAIHTLESWKNEMLLDTEWHNQTFRTAYQKVKESGLEDFTNFPSPELGGHKIPFNNPRSKALTAAVYANSAITHFRENHPFLSGILHVNASVPERIVTDDVLDFYRQKPNEPTYPMERAVALAAGVVQGEMEIETPRVATVARRTIGLLFLLIQGSLFGLIGYAAYRNLTVTV